FFFQAEDGIRDFHVTGVQTCALPIYFVNKTANKIWEIEDYKIREFVGTYDEWEQWKLERKAAASGPAKKEKIITEKKNTALPERSEERRVGKECRST